jgi:hypothetical protein
MRSVNCRFKIQWTRPSKHLCWQVVGGHRSTVTEHPVEGFREEARKDISDCCHNDNSGDEEQRDGPGGISVLHKGSRKVRKRQAVSQIHFVAALAETKQRREQARTSHVDTLEFRRHGNFLSDRSQCSQGVGSPCRNILDGGTRIIILDENAWHGESHEDQSQSLPAR